MGTLTARNLIAVAVLTVLCPAGSAWAVAAVEDATRPEPMAEAPIHSFQRDLLDVAFQAASSYPIVPHIKNRSRAQELVVDACLKLDQPRLALNYLSEIKNWRRGAAYAELARYSAERGWTEPARQYLQMAELIAQADGLDTHRANRIKGTIAETYAMLGESDQAQAVDRGLGDVLPVHLAAIQAMRGGPEDFDQQVKALDALLATENFDLRRYGLERLAELYRRQFASAERREMLHQRIVDACPSVPAFVAIDVLLTASEAAARHHDADAAARLLDRAQQMLDSAGWAVDERVGLMCRIAVGRHRADDPAGAKTLIDEALALFESRLDGIRDYKRADALRPIGEALSGTGRADEALAIYRRAVAYGAVNPNIRPRTDDLTASCVSMALHGVEPDEALWTLIRELAQQL